MGKCRNYAKKNGIDIVGKLVRVPSQHFTIYTDEANNWFVCGRDDDVVYYKRQDRDGIMTSFLTGRYIFEVRKNERRTQNDEKRND